MASNLFGPKVKPEVVLAELEELLRGRPSPHQLGIGSDDTLAWLGRVKAVLRHWDPVESTSMVTIESKLNSQYENDHYQAYRQLMTLLNQARHSIRLATEQVSVVVAQGMVHDYFDGVRKLVETATLDLLFVDPYLDADFVARYMPFVHKGVSVRLLALHKVNTLLPAVESFATQHGTSIAIRKGDKLHDRYLFIDQRECFQSGASFHQGAKTAGTAVIPIVDAFEALQKTYENIWAGATIVR